MTTRRAEMQPLHILQEGVRGVVGGAAGTAAMTLGARWRRERYARRHGLPAGLAADALGTVLDYDDSDHVVIAASRVLDAVIGWSPRGPRGRRALFLLVHWGYGSLVGAGHVGLRRVIGREPAAALVFLAGCQAMAWTLFPLLGDTPPPWRWRRSVLVTSVVQHALYAGVVAAANHVTARRSPSGPSRAG